MLPEIGPLRADGRPVVLGDGSVVVPAAAAAMWAPAMRRLLAEQARLGPVRPAARLVVEAFEMVAGRVGATGPGTTSRAGATNLDEFGEVPASSAGMVLLSGSRSAAALAGVSVAAVRKAVGAGRLRGVKVEGRWVFDPADVEAWAGERRR